jgi:hypothetical protein
MKRREIKFVAGSLQLAPDRIEAAPRLRKSDRAASKRTNAARRKGDSRPQWRKKVGVCNLSLRPRKNPASTIGGVSAAKGTTIPWAARFTVLALSWVILLAALPALAEAQRRAVPRHPPHPQRAVVVRGHVFVGGYFYDPFYGPYPWWLRSAYPYWYFPVYDNRAEVLLRVEPEEGEDAAVYVDGFYAGVVDDFNGVFQSLPLTPGGHTLVLHLEGYRTVRNNFYLSPGATFKLRATLARLPAGEKSELPELAPAVPAPPAGSYQPPVTPAAKPLPPPAAPPVAAVGFGTLDIFVQPTSAEVTIDGQRWFTSDEGHFMLQVPAGKHRVEISKSGYRKFTTEILVGDRETVPVNVSLKTSSS